jgi:hypothetical protein
MRALLPGGLLVLAATGVAADTLSLEGVRFLERFRQLAETPDLFDVVTLQHVLGMRLVEETSEKQLFDCGGNEKNERRMKSLRAEAGGWYARQASGAGDLRLPGVSINPPTTTGEPRLVVDTIEMDRCGTRGSGYRRVTVNFLGLPAYVCITAAQIRQAIPAARWQMATDGYSFIKYAKGSFAFRFGTDCAVSAEVAQDDEGASASAK